MLRVLKPVIAYGKPPIVIVNNGDFKIDMLIGNPTGVHGTNALYVSPKLYEEECNHKSAQQLKQPNVS